MIKKLVDCLKDGGVIIYPTDTLYGMGCDIFHQKAIERICLIKGIDPKKALFSFICSSLSDMTNYTRSISNPIFRILKSAMPGPYTFILPAGKLTPKILKAKRDTVGIRVPDNEICKAMVKELGHPVLSTSLPFEGDNPFTDPGLIEEKYGKLVDIIVDGGIGGVIPSTVIDCTSDEPALIRQGLGEWSVG
jgi:tRNA threonylcarbamoyl adenosine modification protein (Sua5/YciO/YrdC/YwlC family)